MPCLTISTNLPRSRIPEGFVEKIIPILARTVNKPENHFICVVIPDCIIHFRGDNENFAATSTLESIGHIDATRNKVVMKELSEFIQKELGIAPNRFFLTFYDVDKHNVGISGTTMG